MIRKAASNSTSAAAARDQAPARPEPERGSPAEELAATIAAVAAARLRLERGGSVDLDALRDQVARALGSFDRARPAENLRIALLDEATRLVTVATLSRDAAEQELRKLDLGSRAARAYQGGGSGS